jgi:hypothetical protein
MAAAGCAKALDLVTFARTNGWAAEVDEPVVQDGARMISVKVSTSHLGWDLGAIVAWFENPETGSWKLGELDQGGVVGGVAVHQPDGREVEFTVNAVRYLREQIVDPSRLVAWLIDYPEPDGG